LSRPSADVTEQRESLGVRPFEVACRVWYRQSNRIATPATLEEKYMNEGVGRFHIASWTGLGAHRATLPPVMFQSHTADAESSQAGKHQGKMVGTLRK